MPGFSILLVLAFARSEAASLGGLTLGGRLIDRPLLRRLGALSHPKKMRALDTVWPMTRIRPALRRGDVATVAAIITSLVLLKSLASLVLGLVTVIWLPLASLIVPTIIAAEDPDDVALRGWVQSVARLQVTSHVVAAAFGLAVTVAGPLAGRSLTGVIREHARLTVTALALSVGFAIAAGRREALGLVERGV
jgi:hypothetical protein